jgi:uronate dehydrogenase
MYRRVLLTGAAGVLGGVLRPSLAAEWPLRSSDRRPAATLHANEEFVACDLADRAAVDQLVAGCDAVVHFGGIPLEDAFDPILQSNIVGTYNVFEAARRHGARRIVFASSNHVVGFYTVDDVVDADAPVRPDSLYAVSKAYGEALGRYYVDKFDMEVAALRIGAALERPRTRRHVSCWLSYPDLWRLVRACLVTHRIGFTIVYGQSANERTWWDNRKAAHLGYRAQDNSEPFLAEIERTTPRPDPADPDVRFVGGRFAKEGYVKR